tara:strand:+ start:1595 stop:2314 length:720 start_codon:yes stop_codon:yes gene_type:complete
MNYRLEFYKKLILKYLNKESKILVVGSGLNDYQIFQEAGFSNVVFSNFNGTKINNINFKQIDINNIDEKDHSYDYVVAHACIHHCSKPHSGILEMYRVSKNGVLVIESRDSWLMRVMIKFKLAEEYELSAINNEDEFGDHGGVDNTNIPNYVYRWTEIEVKKLINSYNPKYKHTIKFDYKYDYENILNKIKNKNVHRKISFLLLSLTKVLDIFLRKQGNLFSFFIDRKESEKSKHSWIN